MAESKEKVELPTQEELLQTLEPKTEVDSKPDAPVLSEREQQAASFGWKPKDEWVENGGDPEDWRPAKDFLERGEMIGKIRALTKESQDVQKALRHVAEQNKKIYETGYKQAVNDLTAERRQALAEGDLVKADEIGEKLDAAKEELKKVQTPASKPVDPEFYPWVEQNQWYNDPVMRKFADALAIEYVNINNGQPTAAETRDFVAKTVKKEFAHRFNAQKPVAAPSPDGNGRESSNSKSQGTSRLSKIESEMPEEHRQIMKTMLKTVKGMTKEEYLKQYSEAR